MKSMDTTSPAGNGRSGFPAEPDHIRRGGSRHNDPREAARELHEQLKQDDLALVVFFASASYDLDVLESELASL